MTQNSDHPPTANGHRSGRSGSGLSVVKKLVFGAVATVAFFGLVEGALALLGVSPRAYQDDPYVGFSGRAPLFVEETQADGSVVMETSPAKLSLFNMQRFPRAKAPGTTRVFCVGGSTTYGRPYDDATSFCGWLRELLAAAEPDRRWEVINAGGISYASYRVALLMEELVRYQPDLFIVYSGHNEFLERRTYPQIISLPRPVRGIGALASRTRTWTAVEKVVDGIRTRPPKEARGDVLAEEVVDPARSMPSVRRHTIATTRFASRCSEHYRFNLARMVDIARSAGADVVMVTPASNLRDSAPFKSEHRSGLTDAEMSRWNALVREGLSDLRDGSPEPAIDRFREAVEIDPRFAELQFVLGRALYANGSYDEALEAFRRARDEDVCPLARSRADGGHRARGCRRAGRRGG